jgi:hypothetical protein
MTERLAFQKLHHDEGLALVLSEVVNRADVRMIERRGGPGFPLESFHRKRGRKPVFRQEFYGDRTPQVDVLRPVNDTHTPAAEFFFNTVVGYGLANHRFLQTEESGETSPFSPSDLHRVLKEL